MTARRAAAVVALLIPAAVVFALPVGRRSLFNQDEVRYAMLAREVVDHSRWILPHVRGEVYLNKPPLFFWAVALVSLPGGAVTDTSAPLVSVLGPGGVVLAHPDANLAFDFYLRGAIREMPRTDEVRALVRRQSPERVLLIREERWTALQGGAAPSWRAMAPGTVAGRRMLLVGNAH